MINKSIIWVGTFLICTLMMNCSNVTNKETGKKERLVLGDNIPRFGLAPEDSVVYKFTESAKNSVPVEFEYSIDAQFMLTGKGDSVLRSIDFKYLSLTWTWMYEGDTCIIDFAESDFVDSDFLSNTILDIQYGNYENAALNSEEFNTAINKQIELVKGKPEHLQLCLQALYTTVFDNNRIRGKVRQLFRYRPISYIETTFNQFKTGATWSYNLPIQYEAKSLHQVYNQCTIDSITKDEIQVTIAGKLLGDYHLFNKDCINGSMVIDRNKKLLSSFKVQQHYKSNDIPHLYQDFYLDWTEKPEEIIDTIQEEKTLKQIIKESKEKKVRFDRIWNVEMTLVD